MAREIIQGDDKSKWIAHSNHDVKCFTKHDIRRFTNNYETIVGRGAFGEVYEGVLEDKTVVAVKRFIHNVKENFAKELAVHREINHKNVVRLIGYCADENALMMVTEYIPKGNLSDILHQDNMPIPLDTRLRISIECAEALGYMHSHMYTQVIHGDIKPANILLDDRFRAKLSDFGISKLVNTENTLYTLNVIGSIGYMDPLFARNGRLTTKSDVYSFGVVLLELITRKKATREDLDISLVGSFTQALAKGIRRVREMFDAEIVIPGHMKAIEEIAKLAGECLRMELDKRPEMLEVAERLRKLRKILHQGQERVALFSWGRKNIKPALVETPSEEGSSQNLTIEAPTPSEESSSSSQNMRIVSFGSTETALDLKLKELFQASAYILGRGTFGLTYKLKCLTGAELVVKVRRLVGEDLPPRVELEQRIAAIGAIQSEHILPLRGYYYSNDDYERQKLLFVYDNMPMGSLAGVLRGDGCSDRAPMDWAQRSAISLAVARGVESIHSAGPLSFHGNIKSSNVMLSSTHGACVSEHGLTLLFGNSGYISQPKKADVYSFGVLLLEVLSRRAPAVNNTWHGGRVDLPMWVFSFAQEEWAAKVLDVELLGQPHNGVRDKECMMRLLQLAIDCCSENANSRPTMSDVVEQIEEILQS